MPRSRLLMLLVLLAPLVGCSSSTRINRWVATQGGTICDHRLERARTLTVALTNGRHDVPFNIAVLDRADLAAFSWPGGRIFVSRGLVDSLDDAALSAAIAHEMAHVLNHRRPAGVAALSSDDALLAEEVRADGVGVGLLSAAGLPPDAMTRMLERVLRDGNLAPQVRRDLRQRVALLRCAAQPD
jgi:predicted Zn-dependent protease